MFIFAVGTSNTEKEMDSAFKKEKLPTDAFKKDALTKEVLRTETFIRFAFISETFNLTLIEESIDQGTEEVVSFL